eukprot:5540395-Prorocentrum_lima.AAC.1
MPWHELRVVSQGLTVSRGDVFQVVESPLENLSIALVLKHCLLLCLAAHERGGASENHGRCPASSVSSSPSGETIAMPEGSFLI